MSNIAQRNFKFEAMSKKQKSKNKKKPIPPSNNPNKSKPLPEWNNCINDLDKFKLSSTEIVYFFVKYFFHLIQFEFK